jgi:CTP:molybdopterin cytidylyltransferase MocA/spermidine synthase
MSVRIVGLVLAAGEGHRLGRPKALVDVDGERLVDRAVRVLRDGGCDDVYVVLGAASADVPGATAVLNRDWRTGLGSSLRAGLAAQPEDADAVVVTLVDQLGIGPAVIARIVARLRDGCPLVVATYDGVRRNPVGIARSLWPRAAAEAVGDVGARAFVAGNPDLVTAVECADVGAPDDVDTAEDLAVHLRPRRGSARFEELAFSETAMGPISLRRRRDPSLQVDVFEAKLGEEFLMSSLFTVAEVELARLGLAELAGAELDVVVGGLGLGYTARAVLDDDRVRSLLVVETLAEVIDWHQRELLPDTAGLATNPRARLVHADFFSAAGSRQGWDPTKPRHRYDAVLVDIDHTPHHVLHPSHLSFYTEAGLRALATHLKPGGVFALWSDDPPDEPFGVVLAAVFPRTQAHVVTFPNPFTQGESTNTVYVAVASEQARPG